MSPPLARSQWLSRSLRSPQWSWSSRSQTFPKWSWSCRGRRCLLLDLDACSDAGRGGIRGCERDEQRDAQPHHEEEERAPPDQLLRTGTGLLRGWVFLFRCRGRDVLWGADSLEQLAHVPGRAGGFVGECVVHVLTDFGNELLAPGFGYRRQSCIELLEVRAQDALDLRLLTQAHVTPPSSRTRSTALRNLSHCSAKDSSALSPCLVIR